MRACVAALFAGDFPGFSLQEDWFGMCLRNACFWIPACNAHRHLQAPTVTQAAAMAAEFPASPCAGMTDCRQIKRSQFIPYASPSPSFPRRRESSTEPDRRTFRILGNVTCPCRHKKSRCIRHRLSSNFQRLRHISRTVLVNYFSFLGLPALIGVNLAMTSCSLLNSRFWISATPARSSSLFLIDTPALRNAFLTSAST